jgi:hypothetical protein
MSKASLYVNWWVAKLSSGHLVTLTSLQGGVDCSWGHLGHDDRGSSAFLSLSILWPFFFFLKRRCLNFIVGMRLRLELRGVGKILWMCGGKGVSTCTQCFDVKFHSLCRTGQCTVGILWVSLASGSWDSDSGARVRKAACRWFASNIPPLPPLFVASQCGWAPRIVCGIE